MPEPDSIEQRIAPLTLEERAICWDDAKRGLKTPNNQVLVLAADLKRTLTDLERLEAALRKLSLTICPDGSLTEVDELVDLCEGMRREWKFAIAALREAEQERDALLDPDPDIRCDSEIGMLHELEKYGKENTRLKQERDEARQVLKDAADMLMRHHDLAHPAPMNFPKGHCPVCTVEFFERISAAVKAR